MSGDFDPAEFEDDEDDDEGDPECAGWAGLWQYVEVEHDKARL